MELALYLLSLIVFCSCKVYERCELARELFHVHKFAKKYLPTWICIIQHESNFSTSLQKRYGLNGLFQFTDRYHCSPPGIGWFCDVPCSAFLDDDITDDVMCARKSFSQYMRLTGDGFDEWASYGEHCKYVPVDNYTEDCFVGNYSYSEYTRKPHSRNVTTYATEKISYIQPVQTTDNPQNISALSGLQKLIYYMKHKFRMSQLRLLSWIEYLY